MKTVLILNHNQEHLGTYYRCRAFGNALSARGFRVKMICASGSNLDLLIRKKSVAKNFDIYTLPRIKYHRYFSGQLLRLFLTGIMVMILRFDICHAFTMAQPQIAIPAWMAKVMRRKILFIDWDDMWGGGFADEHHSIIAKVLWWHERYFLSYADKITYVSEFIHEEIEKSARKNPKICDIKKYKLPNGADSKSIPVLDVAHCRDKLGIEHRLILLSVGNTYTQSLKFLLESFGLIREVNSQAVLYLVGGAIIPEEYQDEFEKHRDHIVMVGRVSQELLPYYMGAADILLLPMEDNVIEKARFPMRFGDYLSAGRPIVSNAVGEVRYYLDKFNAGLACSPILTREFADGVIKILDDPKLGRELSLNARRLAENELSWKVVFEKLENMYLEDCGG